LNRTLNRRLKINEFIMKWMKWVIGVVIGLAAGYLYWYYVGCLSGTCSITSSPLNSALYGGVMGALVVNVFTPSRDTAKEQHKK